jgi:hypothetical protein
MALREIGKSALWTPIMYLVVYRQVAAAAVYQNLGEVSDNQSRKVIAIFEGGLT